MADLIHLIHQALPLPKGLIRQIMPEVIWQQRVYAYQLEVIVGQAGTLRVDARQLPISIPSLQGQYGELADTLDHLLERLFKDMLEID